MRRLVIILCLLGAILGLGFYWRYGAAPRLGKIDPVSIVFRVVAREPENEYIAALTNLARIMSALRHGRPTGTCTCIDSGSLILQYTNGLQLEIGTFTAAAERNYFFTTSGYYYVVPRAAFISALVSAGVDAKKIPLE